MRLPALLFGIFAALPAAADDAWDKVLLLQKAKRHITESVKQLPDYTCLQTSARYRKKAGEKEQERPTDTVVLEVLNAGAKELFASPGAKGFQTEDQRAFTGHGLSGTGAFGLFLRTIFLHDNAMFTYRGEELLRGRKAVRWLYRVPVTLSGYTVMHEFARATVAMAGSFAVDAETLDLMRLVVSADEIPPNLPLTAVTQTIDYGLTRIGTRDVVLPQSASMKVVEESGAHSRNEVEFTHCQSFRVESSISFNAPAAGLPAAAQAPDDARPMEAGLTVTIELVEAVTPAHTVGTPIEARVVADVRERGRVVVPAGSAVRGRVRRLERVEDRWAVGLEFTDVETETGTQRFYANLVDVDKLDGLTFLLKTAASAVRRRQAVDTTWLPYLPGVAQFFVPALPVPRGFKSVWKTTSPRTGTR